MLGSDGPGQRFSLSQIRAFSPQRSSCSGPSRHLPYNPHTMQIIRRLARWIAAIKLYRGC